MPSVPPSIQTQQTPQQVPHAPASSSATSAPTVNAPATPIPATSEPHKFMPNMTAASAPAPPGPSPSLPPSHRPSVEPLTPVPGSPAVQNGTPLIKRSMTENNAADLAVKEEDTKLEDDDVPTKIE
ncbi:sequence-specific DNA binding [Ascochyta rabiei]|uniref:Sequence-specific DNA binding n=2 Tax=Didymella rabiei TaxID=5454 RepID=A0A162WGI6_DIDRA|nr:sequence-specific DNA binding [Ascochyta rabiei]